MIGGGSISTFLTNCQTELFFAEFHTNQAQKQAQPGPWPVNDVVFFFIYYYYLIANKY